MLKKIEYFIFKRLFPFVVIIVGVYGEYYLFFVKQYENVALQSMAVMASFLVIVLGLIFISNETSLRRIYIILKYVFFFLFLYLVFMTGKNVGNLELSQKIFWIFPKGSLLEVLYSFLGYGLAGALWITFYLASKMTTHRE